MKIAIHDAETEHLKHKTFPNYDKEVKRLTGNKNLSSIAI